jgi:hypothetical protein
MVKIKKGYVMNPREQVEFDRVNVLPRKASGTVAYYFKPQTKYPPRIYVFMHAEIWCDRNRRPMGLFHAFPFLVRPMNREEIEYHHFDTRLCYHQYEDWDKLIFAEEKEAAQLNSESAGTGTGFLEKLKAFRPKYPLRNSLNIPPVVKPPDLRADMRELIASSDKYLVSEIGGMLDKEQQGEKRLGMLVLLRELYREKAGDTKHKIPLTTERIERKVFLSQERSRKNFVRRVYAANPLFALAEIQVRYAGYDEQMLFADLRRKPARPKRKKHKPVTDLRRCQLRKLAVKLQQADGDDKVYHTICERMAILEEAHRLRLPIPIPVKLQGVTKVYSFHWKTREEVVKAFVDLANGKGVAHPVLEQRYNEIVSSNYSF